MQMNRLASFNAPKVMVESSGLPESGLKYSQPVKPTLMENDKKEFSIDVVEKSVLFIGDALLPGWKAYVDGVQVAILRANYIYGAVPVSVGRHLIKLEYKQ
jgi:uncharacterized membrane protein YfhO